VKRLAFGFVCLIACGGQDGLPITGDIVLNVGEETVTPTVGAAIRDRDANKLLVVIGTRDISCETNLESPLRKGSYVTLVIDPTVGVQSTAQVTVIRVDSSGTLFNGGPDEVTIDVVEGRVAGSVDFATTDETDEGIVDLAASGTFDVENCL
jgi:hypothetical protein